MDKIQKNVLGENLEICSKNPLTGWYRDGCCNTKGREFIIRKPYKGQPKK